MQNTNKTFVVRQVKGIESIVIEQKGSGYDEEIPPTIIIDGNGTAGKLEAVVSSIGSIDTVNIINSGANYTSSPRVILSHPQVFKKADYYVTTIDNNNYVSVNDIFVNDDKETFFCGKTKDATGNTVAFVAKYSSLGVKEWERSLESTDGQNYTEFEKIFVDGNDIWVVGNNRPNANLLDVYNPDIILCKYEQEDDGLDASLQFQKGYAGISGANRADYVTAIKKYSDIRYIIGGYTNTNSLHPDDAFLASIDTTGNFAVKRKIASQTLSERLTDLLVVGDNVYFTMETATSADQPDINIAFGKATIGVNAITVDWVKEFSNTVYSLVNPSLAIDEFNEFYITAGCRNKSDDITRDSFWVCKLDINGDIIWNYRYLATGREVHVVDKCVIDIFGDLNVAYTKADQITKKTTVGTIKIGYDGTMKKHSTNEFNLKRIEGITAKTVGVDNSGDVYVYGQEQWNRNEFILDFASTITDVTGHYTLTDQSANNSIRYQNGVAKIDGCNVPANTQTTWENGHIKASASDLGTTLDGDFTIEMMVYIDGQSGLPFSLSQNLMTLCQIGSSQDPTGGLWLGFGTGRGLDLTIGNNTTQIVNATAISSASSVMLNDTWISVGLTKNGNLFKAYINGIQVISGTISNTSFGNKDLYFGVGPGFGAGVNDFAKDTQGQFYLDDIRVRNRGVVPTSPADINGLPQGSQFGFSYAWTDTAWFASQINRYDYIDYNGFGLKIDKNADSDRLGDQGLQTNTQIGFARTDIATVTGTSLTIGSTGYELADAGFQSLDFDDATTLMSQDTETLTFATDVWSARTSTVPSPGSQKLKVSAVVKDRYYIKPTSTIVINNIQELTLNQSFDFTVGSKLVLQNQNGTFINSGYIIRKDTPNKKIYLAIIHNPWTDDLSNGELITQQFSEQDSYGIIGPVPNDINEIKNYNFVEINNTTPGTFDIDLSTFDAPSDIGGTNNLDDYARLKEFDVNDYSIRIDEVAGGSTYIPGSVVDITSSDITFNTAYSTCQITNLAGVLKITLTDN